MGRDSATAITATVCQHFGNEETIEGKTVREDEQASI